MDGLGPEALELLNMDEHTYTSLSAAEAKRILAQAGSKKLLSDQLASLDRHFNEVLDRWNTPQDFSKVDLVCAELLKKGSMHDALKYMERVRSLVDLICAKLGKKNGADKSEPKEKTQMTSDAAHLKTIESVLDDVDDPLEDEVEAPAESKAESSKDAPKKKPAGKRRGEDALSARQREQDLQSEKTELTRQVKELEKALKEDRAGSKDVQKSLKGAQGRLVQKSLELQASETKREAADRDVKVLNERIEGLQALLRHSEASAKREHAKFVHLRNTIAERDIETQRQEAMERRLEAAASQGESAVVEAEAARKDAEKEAEKAAARADKAMAKLKAKIEAQAKELQRRDEILHIMSAKLQEANPEMAFQLPVAEPSAGEGATPDASSKPGTPAAAAAEGSEAPSEAASPMPASHDESDSKLPAINKTPTSSQAKAKGGKKAAKAKAQPDMWDSAAFATQVRVAQNPNPGASKPWVVHQAMRCEPAGHVQIQGAKEVQTIEMTKDVEALKLCCCGMLPSAHFALVGDVHWRGRTCVITPSAGVAQPGQGRGILGAESAN